MPNVKSGGGPAAIWYTIRKSFEAYGGPLAFWRRMSSKNACKTCAYGMGGSVGGMRNELGHFPEFCKKSVQAMAADMQAPLPSDFFDRHSLSSLSAMTSRELENLGRLAYPIALGAGDTHFRRIDWNQALDRVATGLKNTDPRRAFFYSSGRSSNEAAFLLQWLGRVYGTNNIHNCSYYCHQASGVGLGRSIGSGTATVTLDDVEHADFVLLIGANPASNHPRLISTLSRIRANGGKVVVINPLREVALDKFRIPSSVTSMLVGSTLNDLYVQPRIGGDVPLLKGVLKAVVQRDAVDTSFISQHTTGWEEMIEGLSNEAMDDLAENAGVSVAEIEAIASMYIASHNAVFMWAMGVTHHAHGVDNVAAIANLALARGMVGRRNAGLMPIRGHSNVQGIGSVGVAPRVTASFLEAMEKTYGLVAPTWEGLNSVESIEAADRGEIDFAFYLGGNFYASNPDLSFAQRALGRVRLSVHVSTKLNQGHVIPRPSPPDGEVIVLPTVVRDEELQATTQESMFSFVRLSSGGMKPPSGELRTEVDIITSIGARLLPHGPIDFDSLRDHKAIRKVIADVVPGYRELSEIDETKHEFHVTNRVRHQPTFGTDDGRARFIAVETPIDEVGVGEFRMMSIRSEGQFNTVVYEEHDRYRNQSRRDVVLMNKEDIASLGLGAGDRVTVFNDTGTMHNITISEFDIARGCVAMYYPEANILVPRVVDPLSGTPVFKNARVRITS